jgi:aspartyl-tRNA(Asn)/glutamyl-tRNA(Gln) amidotransferase subunit C
MSEAISEAEMQHLKKLARLEMSDAETERAKTEINKILGSFDQLQKLNLEAVPEMPRPVALVNVLREDVAEIAMSQAEALAVGVEVNDGFFQVPRTVE